MQGDVEVLRTAYDAFARRDLGAVLDALDPEIEWTIPEGARFAGGTHRGHVEALASILMAPHEDLDAFSTEPEEFLDCGPTVVVLGCHRGSHDGRAFEIPFAHVWTLAGGLCTRCRSYVDTALLNALVLAPDG